jgi:hypothetical protein
MTRFQIHAAHEGSHSTVSWALGAHGVYAYISDAGGRSLDSWPPATTFQHRFDQITALAAGDQGELLAEEFGLFVDDAKQPTPATPTFNRGEVNAAVTILAASTTEYDPPEGLPFDFQRIETIVGEMLADGQTTPNLDAHWWYKRGRERASTILRDHRQKFELVYRALLRWKSLDARHLAEILGPNPC